MNDIDTEAVDAAAASFSAEHPAAPAPPEQDAAAAPEEPAGPQYPTVATGDRGADVLKLTNLLNYLGYATGETAGKEVLDGDVLGDVDTARAALGVSEDPPEQVGAATWAALYEAAAAKQGGSSPAS